MRACRRGSTRFVLPRKCLQRWKSPDGTRPERSMEIGFIGVGTMGFHMVRRLIEAGHKLIVHDTRREAVDRVTKLGAKAGASPRDVADRVESVMASLPTVDASIAVATGKGGVIEGKKVRRFIDLSTIGARAAKRIAEAL